MKTFFKTIKRVNLDLVVIVLLAYALFIVVAIGLYPFDSLASYTGFVFIVSVVLFVTGLLIPVFKDMIND